MVDELFKNCILHLVVRKDEDKKGEEKEEQRDIGKKGIWNEGSEEEEEEKRNLLSGKKKGGSF